MARRSIAGALAFVCGLLWLQLRQSPAAAGADTGRLLAAPAAGSRAVSGPGGFDLEILLEDFGVTDCGTGSQAAGCHRLTRTHSGAGDNPTASPPCEELICGEGRYGASVEIQLTARPALGWDVGSWSGTDDDSSTSLTNATTMPAADKTVAVHYVQTAVTEFSSSFEVPGFGDWSEEFCRPCNVFSGTVGAWESSYPAGLSFHVRRPGTHRGLLVADEESDLDLLLWWWNGSEWLPVASARSPHSHERLEYEGLPGIYRWEVRSAARAGAYELLVQDPSLGGFAVNRIEQSVEQMTDGRNSLKSVYVAGARGVNYLIDRLPGVGGGKGEYTVSFKLRPMPGLSIRSQKHQILQIRQAGDGPKRLLEVILTQVKEVENRYAIVVRARENGKKSATSPELRFGTAGWTQFRIEWRPVGEGRSIARVFRRPRKEPEPAWESPPLKAGGPVSLVYFGQVTRGNRRTAGEIFFDEFESSWNQ